MLPSVRTFLEGIIDYAGLFPPAELPLAQAMANYLRYRNEPEGWMLGRFICPAARLKELPAFRTDIGPIAPLRLTILGRGGKDVPEFMANLKLDLEDVVALGREFAVAESYEVKLPVLLFGNNPSDLLRVGQIAGLMSAVARLLDTVSLVPFYECPWPEPKAVDQFAEGLRMVGNRRAGWKLRCGGLQASAFPSPRQVARVLAESSAANIPWKATAGLHHPLRHFDEKLQTSMHGFVNVFGAGILAHALVKTGSFDNEIETMLADEDASHFVVSEAGFSWKEHRATTEAIRLARQDFVTSFGSCSFDEPRDDLRRLGWI
jgi:hypothetical protein